MIIIEGIIGVGKTTLAQSLHEEIPRSKLYKEPVGDNPYLEKFYKDPGRWALEMQYFLMARRYQMHAEAVEYEWANGSTTIFDRSIYGDKAFADILYQDGFIDDIGYQSYMQHRECMQKQLLIPQQIIYLDVPIETALSRIHKRGRNCESSIPGEYLEKLAKAYEIILDELSSKTNVQRYRWNDGCGIQDIKIMGLCEYDNANVYSRSSV